MQSKKSIKKQTLMARQPIFNVNKETVAYELLYRADSISNEAVFDFSGSVATVNVLLNAYTSIYQNNQLKRMPAFINLTYDLLVNGTLPKLPSNQIVLEILEDVEVTPALIESVKALREKGYTIALDDFIYDDKFIALIKLVQIIKVDVIDMSFAQVTEQVHKLKPYKVTLLAEKIETHAMFKHCKELGFKLFQGYFLSKPEIVEGINLNPTRTKLLALIQALQNPNISVDAIENLILQDPVFTFKIQRIVNSSAHGLVPEISSIKEAIIILGVPEIKKWALIIVMLSNDNKSEELARQLLIRGCMCEKIALASGVKDATGYMIAGMMSGVNALLDIELEDLLDQTPLSSEIKAAISTGNGVMGKILQNTINFGNGNWRELSHDIDNVVYDNAYRESLNWATTSISAVNQT